MISSVPIVSAWDEGWPWQGTYYLCHVGEGCASNHIPTNVTTLFMNIAGGGGSGASSGTTGGYSTWGYGGSAGEYGNYTMVSVPLGTNYTIIVGAKGPTANHAITGPNSPAVSHAGGDTSAFGRTKHGGAGGLMGGASNSNGGVGASTNYMGVFTANAGGSITGYSGGLGGTGYGAGGGGAAGNMTNGGDGYPGVTYGGAGMDGYVGVWDMNGSGTNVPYYIASPTSTGYGNIVTFTDESILNDAGNLTYNWDFGDGSTHGTTRGTTTHVYSTYGVFTTNLTLTSDMGTVYLNKTDYITITNTPITAWYTQKIVPFKIVDAYGADLPGANVSVRYISNTLPSKDPTYLTSAFGISQAVATQMVNGDIAMQGYTGSNGQISFMMFPAIQYGITITNISAGLSNYVEIYPTDSDYVIRCPLGSQVMPTMASTSLANSSLYVTEPNSSWITWNLLYSDPSGHTTGLTWNVTCWNNMTVMYANSWGAVGTGTVIIDNYTFPSEPKGMEYVAVYDARRDIP